MQSLWNETEAAQYPSDLDLRVYTSRLLGSNPALVMHGGGNTSVKSTVVDLFGERQDILYVKGSGWDLATIEAKGFTPARLDYLQRLATLDALPDLQMANELRRASIDASAPAASVEAILHAIIPQRFVDHTHADAILALTNNPNGREHVRNVFGDDVVVIPYVMPGFLLAKLCAEEFPRQYRDGMQGMILLQHGIFTFGDTAQESYERMIALVSRAEAYLARVRSARTRAGSAAVCGSTARAAGSFPAKGERSCRATHAADAAPRRSGVVLRPASPASKTSRAGTADAGSRHSHQARAAVRVGCRCLCRRLQSLF